MDEVFERIKKIRHDWGESDAARDAGYKTPLDVERQDDIVYGEDRVWQSLDVYRPRGAEGELPVIVSVHGGGWVYGTKEVYQFYCMDLCRRGFIVINFNYRLSPEHPFPAALEDTNSVFSWLLENAAEYGIDTQRVYAVGDSAGAHILALYAASWAERRYAKEYALTIPSALSIKAIALNCGAYSGPRGELAAAVLGGVESDEARRKMDAIHKIGYGFPPVFCMTASGDFLKKDAVKLFRRLLQKNVPCECRLYGTKEDVLPHVFHVDIKRKAATLCNDDTIAWFNRWR